MFERFLLEKGESLRRLSAHTSQSNQPAAAPRWQLHDIYPGLDSAEYLTDKAKLASLIGLFQETVLDSLAANKDFGAWLRLAVDRLNETLSLNATLSSYAYCCFSVDTTNSLCLAELNKLEELTVPLAPALTSLRTTLSNHASQLEACYQSHPDLAEYAWLFAEQVMLAQHQMSAAEESLAADLGRSGSEAFTRLQEALSSSLSRTWSDGSSKTVVELRGLAHDPDRAVRRQAFELELSAWQEHRIAFAASLNGVKGAAVTLASRRSWQDNLEQSASQSRISLKTLESLTAAMSDSLPDFRRYMKAKAQLLGQDQLAFYDLFAPLEGLEGNWSFDRVRSYIVERFASFSPDLAAFARMAFDKQWIDALPRPGKVGGAYCIDFPLRGQTRVMSNFSGNFDSVITIAHELGHAWHSWLLNDKPTMLRDYPMTLAETASLFCETLVYKDEMKRSEGQQALALLEMRLSDINQIITDILSRFIFEKAVFGRRATGELSPDDFCDLMLDAQKQTYGDALDPQTLHPYMWAVKGHYYHAGLNFYNYPYAFGQLFGLGLYALSRREPHGFTERYIRLLRRTGQVGAVQLCSSEGMDIESIAFWTASLDQVREDIKVFCDLAQIKLSGGRP